MTRRHNCLATFCLQIDIAFKKFDQTGNDKLNFREFCDMMNRKANEKLQEKDKEELHSDPKTN